jgi:hypothetical protein
MKNFAQNIASLLALSGGVFILFAITLASDSEAFPSACISVVCFVMSIWIFSWYEEKKNDDRTV